ncbi:MAG: DUF4012 domain-containing protein [SAR202 cluster bacterium]|nr:DUF4012 domain-containing protein [SAR202 cluster bacterium]
MGDRKQKKTGSGGVAAALPHLLERGGRRVWHSLVFVTVLAITVVSAKIAIDLAPLAAGASDRIRDLRDISSRGVTDADTKAIDDLKSRVATIEGETGALARSAGWASRLSSAASWLPWADREVKAWATQAGRVHRDVLFAGDILESSAELMSTLSDAQTVMLAPTGSAAVDDLASKAQQLEATFATTLNEHARASRSVSKVRPSYTITPAISAMDFMTESEARMQSAAVIGQQASGLLADLMEIGASARPFVGQFNGSATGPMDFAALKATMAKLDTDLQFALVRSESLTRLVADSGQSTELLARLRLLNDMESSLQKAAKAAYIGVDVLEPAFAEVKKSGGGLLGPGGTLAPVITAVSARQQDIASAVALPDDSRRTLAKAGSSGSAAEIAGMADLQALVANLADGMGLLNDIAPIGESIIGADGSVKRYLVLGQTADELRATGGFVSSVWLVTFESGGLRAIDYYDAVFVDDWDKLVLYPSAPAGLRDHINATVWLMRDVSWEPHFPVTAQTAADMFVIGQGIRVDGVVAINQWTLLGLVQAIGDIPAPDGGPDINQRNLFARLEEGTDLHGRAYMDVVLQGAIRSLDSRASLPTMLRLGAAMRDSLEKREMLVYMSDPAAQGLMALKGWDGSVTQSADMDYLYVVDSNVGWSKADRNIERTVHYQVDLKREKGARINLRLRYNNHSGPGSPGCEPQWLNRDTNYSQLKNACYWDFWRAYVPRGGEAVKQYPLPLSMNTVAAEIGRGDPGKDTVATGSTYDKTVLSGLFAVGAQQTKEINLVYYLPSRLTFRDGETIKYQLLLQKQPGSRYRDVTLEFLLPSGYRVASSSVALTASGATPRFQVRVDQDMLFEVVFAKKSASASD